MLVLVDIPYLFLLSEDCRTSGYCDSDYCTAIDEQYLNLQATRGSARETASAAHPINVDLMNQYFLGGTYEWTCLHGRLGLHLHHALVLLLDLLHVVCLVHLLLIEGSGRVVGSPD